MPMARRSTAAREIHSPPWTAVLYRAEVFQRVGLLEERFESYLEDADFGLRCAALGIAGRYVPEARAVHVGSASLGRWHRGHGAPHGAQSGVAGGAPWASGATGGRCWWRRCCGARWRCATGAVSPGLRGKWQGICRFSAARRQNMPDRSEALAKILRDNERFIRA